MSRTGWVWRSEKWKGRILRVKHSRCGTDKYETLFVEDDAMNRQL